MEPFLGREKILTERERTLSEREEKVTRYDFTGPTKLNLNICSSTITLIKLHCSWSFFFFFEERLLGFTNWTSVAAKYCLAALLKLLIKLLHIINFTALNKCFISIATFSKVILDSKPHLFPIAKSLWRTRMGSLKFSIFLVFLTNFVSYFHRAEATQRLLGFQEAAPALPKRPYLYGNLGMDKENDFLTVKRKFTTFDPESRGQPLKDATSNVLSIDQHLPELGFRHPNIPGRNVRPTRLLSDFRWRKTSVTILIFKI